MDLEKEHKFLKFMHRAFESRNPKDPLSLSIDIFYTLIILTSAVFCILEVTDVWEEHKQVFEIFEYIMVGFFAFEWIESFLTIDFDYPELPPVKRKLKWIFSLESITDLICLTIFLLTIFLEDKFEQIAYLELISLIKLVRLYKLFKYKDYIKQRKEHKKEKQNV